MNTMTALVKADFIKLFSLKKTLLLFGIITMGFALLPQMLLFSFAVALYGLLYTALAYDDSNGAYYWYGTLPVNRRQIFQSKYLFALAMILLLILITGLLSTLSSLVTGNASPEALLISMIIAVTGGMTFTAITLPLTLCLGSAKSRIYALILYIGCFAAMGQVDHAWLEAISRIPWFAFPFLPLLFLGSCLLLALGYVWGIGRYCRKEFKAE
ncbi:MAG TPA: hypothetical protein DIT32_07690 [Peptococcaceae bacterium]|nr:hypothetical protein [Peptococcaceae bacterium]